MSKWFDTLIIMNTRQFFAGRTIGFIVVITFVAIFYVCSAYIYNEKQTNIVSDYKNATYVINNEPVTLVNGIAVTKNAPDAVSKTTTSYFGNELQIDLNNDGQEDVAFILTQNTSGTETFFYAVGAVITEQGYVGTEGYLLGDRIAPQTTEISPNPRHKNVIVFNYMDRTLDESMITQPHIGKSVYLKLVPETFRWAIVEPDFEGESNLQSKEISSYFLHEVYSRKHDSSGILIKLL